MDQSNRIPAEQCQNRALLLLGSNAEDSEVALKEALRLLAEVAEVLEVGSLWQTAAWGFEGPDFLNQVVEVYWPAPLDRLMELGLTIETQLGRVRNTAASTYENRRIDIDILLWSEGEYQSDLLTVPHPRMHLRRFVLQPLAEKWGDWFHSIQNLSVAELLTRCGDENLVHLHTNN